MGAFQLREAAIGKMAKKKPLKSGPQSKIQIAFSRESRAKFTIFF